MRGAGGLVVAPPSLHKSGNVYLWELPPEKVELAAAPTRLLDLLRAAKGTTRKKGKQASSAPRNGPTNGKLIFTVGKTNDDVAGRAVAYLEKCPPAVSGQSGHDQTFAVARAIVHGFDLGPEIGFELLNKHYNPHCLPPWSEAELRHKCAEADTKPYDKPRGYLLAEDNSGAPAISTNTILTEADIETLPMPPPPPWPILPPEALHGLAGEIVTTLAPQTESDPVAILGQLLVSFGSAAGRKPSFLVEGDAHHANLFGCFVGESSRGRKGTSRGRVRQVMAFADDAWCKNCVAGGLSSGEGLIWQVRDPIEKKEPIKQKGRVVNYQTVIDDHGIEDKRFLADEPEFGQVLRVLQREGNSLSPVIRQSWDTGNLRTLTKNNPAKATGAHIAIIGHITKPELTKYLRDTEALNGFANRFLWLCCKRSRLLPDGGRALDLSPLGMRLNYALAAARNISDMTRTKAASGLWHEVYPTLTAERHGLYGAITGRAEAQVLRLSMVYALLDTSAEIGEAHLRAALALWSYADASARLIFGAAPTDPLPGLVLTKLRESVVGMTRTELHDAFNKNLPANKLISALATLRDRGEAVAEPVQTGGRPAERWKAVRKNEESPSDKGGLTSFVRSPSQAKAEEVVTL